MTATEQVRRDIPLLRGPEALHYLDAAATGLMPAHVLRTVGDYDGRARGNIGRGVHAFAEAADAAYERARGIAAAALGAAREEVVFVGGATAGLNRLADALGGAMKAGELALLSVAEHHANLIPWQLAARRFGFGLKLLPADGRGAPDLEAARRALATENIRVVALTHASNVTGAVADLAEAAAMAKGAGATMVVDGAQYAPHAFPRPHALGADFYVLAGHKCGAPNGVGLLWGRREALEALPLTRGGGGMVGEVWENDFEAGELPRRLEPGTPPISPAIGLGAALEWMGGLPLERLRAELAELAEELAEEIAAIAGARVLSARSGARIPLVSFALAGAHSHDVCEWLSHRRVAARGGHHCARLLMRALGTEECVRFSLGPYSTRADVRAAAAATREAAEVLR